uniref:Uncharacterized protein n=1 Tax=Oryza sativa subsp. japonica TaxID=39947 RepID=Q6K366_ORYSJ|nr:hypothetical protein [Oryza sativa Japonica Group]BAD36825.1 hypothetical protein [Oryza sativa Japonica Group]
MAVHRGGARTRLRLHRLVEDEGKLWMSAQKFGALADFYLDKCSFLGGILEEYRGCRYTLLRIRRNFFY